jgi:nucleotide-binding universal stress UspA family protein
MYIIVPTDFSEVSINAAQFAAHMLQGQTEASILLYHVYSDEKKENEVNQSLRELKDRLVDESLVKIDCVAECNANFIESLERKSRHMNAAMVVMSISEKSKLEQVISSSNSLKIIDSNICPVLVIPEGIKFSQIKNVALACDFKDVEKSIPLIPVKNILGLFNANLHVVNINSEIYVSLNEEDLQQREALKQMFSEFNPEFYFITTFDFHDTLRQFIADQKIDLVLTFPRKHSFINNLIKGNNTKKLVYESSIPVLAAHE